MFWITNAFTGLAPLIWHFGVAGVLVAALLAAAYFSPVFKSTFLWLALAVGIAIGGYATGVENENARIYAQQRAAVQHEAAGGRKARADAEKAFPPVPDAPTPVPSPGVPHNRLDKWDRPN